MKSSHAALLLAAVIAARSTSLLFSTVLLADMGPFTMLGERFLAAFAVLVALLWRRLRAAGGTVVARGAVLGVLLFATMAFEATSLTMTASSTVAFLENTAVVIVPVASALMARRLPGKRVLVAALLALAGVALVVLGPQAGTGSGQTLSFGPGEALVMGAACCYSAVIMATARFSREGDALVLGVVQVGVVGVLGMGAVFAFEQPALPTGAQQWGAMLELVAVCTVFGFTVQPMAQRFVSVDTAGLFCAITPLVGGVLGVTFLHEPFGPATLAGMGLILAAIAVSAMGSNLEGTTSRRRRWLGYQDSNLDSWHQKPESCRWTIPQRESARLAVPCATAATARRWWAVRGSNPRPWD